MAASQADTGRFAPTGAIIVMGLVLTGFAIMWDSPYDQFQGYQGGSGLLVICLLALAEVAVMAPTVVIVARLLARLAKMSNEGRGAVWLALIAGGLLTLAGAIMGPTLFMWISNLNAADLSERQPLLILYLLVPLVGVLLLVWSARNTLRTVSVIRQEQSRN